MSSQEKLKAQLEALRQNFIDQLPARLQTLESGLEKWSAAFDEVELVEFHRAAHSLTGAGATFGCDQLSTVARALELQLVSSELAKDIETVEKLLDEVRLAIGNAAQCVQAEPDLPPAVFNKLVQNENCLVYIIEDEEETRNNMVVQFEHFGYAIKVFATPPELIAAVESQRPTVIIADIILAEGDFGGIDVINSINSKLDQPIPAIFISSDDSFAARLAAVRAGGRAYFTKPLSIELMVDIVDELASVEESQAYRVLIVDDSESEALYFEKILEQAGMKANIVCDPMKVLDAIREHSPELVLMDMYMPKCNGVELASVIRQQPSYLGLPIVFLSAETNRESQLEAMRLGGDDFLTKPIKSSHLIASVSYRTERYRSIRSRMSQDSLTGLLNHRRIMESVNKEVARIQRHGGQLAFAMLDIDHFKNVNDNYGHAVGDRVIKSLSRMLKQRLRTTDIIGRYGGEEFAVIMPETSTEVAVKVINEIREHFASLQQYSNDECFHSTLSAGVASSPPIASVGELLEASDQMLYKAKQNGRNQVLS